VVHNTVLFTQWEEGSKYHISLHYQIPVTLWSFCPIISRRKELFPIKQPFLPMGKEEIPFYQENSNVIMVTHQLPSKSISPQIHEEKRRTNYLINARTSLNF
jgi:hypothetical protein